LDTLSSILRNIHLKGSVYFSSCFCSPWGLDIDINKKASFHIVVRGQCWLQMEHLQQPIPLVGGDIVILPHGARHQIFDNPDSPCQNGAQVVANIIHGNNPFAGDNDHFNIVCGYFEFDRSAPNYFLDALPQVIHLTQQQRQEFGWLDTALQLVITEASMEQPGKALLLDRVTELLFIQVIRAFIQLNRHSENYFAALNDRALSKALSLMHSQPDNDWTLDNLGSQVGMSRSRFAQHFHQLVGITPMRYLLSCRMQLAKQQIQETGAPLNKIAELVGYASDSAFKKAFKRFFGQTPAYFRKQKKRNTN